MNGHGKGTYTAGKRVYCSIFRKVGELLRIHLHKHKYTTISSLPGENGKCTDLDVLNEVLLKGLRTLQQRHAVVNLTV